MEDHRFFLEKCIELGKQAAIDGNPPAGAIIVSNQRIIGEAQEASRSKNDITCHAEIEALRAAVKRLNSNDLSGCIMYTNYEPCVMCSYAIRYHRIKRVVYQHKVPFFGGISSAVPVLTTEEVPGHWSEAPEVIHVPDI